METGGVAFSAHHILASTRAHGYILMADRRIESGCNKRRKVETTFLRYKTIVGPAMRAKGLASQRVEARIWCRILNAMTSLGMPDGEMIG